MSMPTWLVALDPGTRHAGVALYSPSGVLLSARDLATTTCASVSEMCGELETVLPITLPGVGTLLSEWPRKYATARAAHADLDGLREVVQWAEGARPWAACRRVTPGTWKGHVPKHIHHQRIAEALGPDALDRVEWETLGPDARDAIALGWWAFHEGSRRVWP